MSPMPNAHTSNGTASPRENGLLMKKMEHSGERIPHSPRSGTSSNASTPSNKKMEEKPSTPLSKSVTPTNGTNGEKMPKPPLMNPNYPPYLAGMPPELAAAQYGAGPMPGHPGALNNYGPQRPPLQMGFEAHPSMRAPPLMMPAGKS